MAINRGTRLGQNNPSGDDTVARISIDHFPETADSEDRNVGTTMTRRDERSINRRGPFSIGIVNVIP